MVSKYEELGASATKSGLHSILDSIGISTNSGLFASITEDIAGSKNHASFLHCDGAGTKSLVSYLIYKSSNAPEAFAGLAQDALVMNLDDIFCIGIPERLVLSNLIARNIQTVPDEAIQAIIKRYFELAEELRQLDIPLEIGGGETSDCGDVVNTLLVDAVLTGRIERAKLINTNAISAGDVIVGLASFGQASYETKPNSGIGSNGLTLARHALLNHKYFELYPEIASLYVEKTKQYQGPYSIDDTPPDLEMSVGAALSSPTRTYAPVLQQVYQKLGSNVHGVIHCTGGGQSKVLRFGKGCRYIKDALFDAPQLFNLIQQHAKVDWKEMYQVFNMGHRIELYVPAENVETIIDIASDFNILAKQIGYVEASGTDKNELFIRSPHGEFEYRL